MTEKLTATHFATLDLPDWRWVLGTIEAAFVAETSYSQGADLVAAIGRLADEADHHPAVDLRYPGVVSVVLTTHAADGVTERDVALAGRISAAAAEAGLVAQPGRAQRVEIAIDAIDIAAVLPFWRAALAYREVGPPDAVPALVDPRGIGPSVWFQQMDEPRPQRNRIHLDIDVPHDEVDERLAAALAAGGTLVSDARARAFWVLADAEGNEACLCTWEDRD